VAGDGLRARTIAAAGGGRARAYFGRRNQDTDQIGFIDASTQAIFGRSYAAEPDALIQQLKEDEAIAAADTLLLTVPNQLGVDYNTHVIDSILTHVAPGHRPTPTTRPSGPSPWPSARCASSSPSPLSASRSPAPKRAGVNKGHPHPPPGRA